MKATGSPSLRTILLTEVLERLAFVGMQSLLVLYLVNFLLKPDHIGAVVLMPALATSLGLSGQPLAAAIVGGFSALIYLAPIGGGIIADRWLGQRSALLLGGSLLALGYALLALEVTFLPAMALLVIGTGFYKGNIAAQLGALYPAADTRRADAFQQFFIAVALISIAAPLLIGSLGERVSWHTGFIASAAAMAAGVILYWQGTTAAPDKRRRVTARVRIDRSDNKRRALALLALLPLVALIVQLNFQLSNAYLTWGERSFALVAFGRRLPASWLLTLDAIVGTAMLLAVTLFWRWWRRRRPEPDELTKVIIGSGFTLLGALALVAAAASADADGGGIGLAWPIAFHACNDTGMALVLPVLLALATKLAPAGWESTVAGFYFFALFIGGLLAGWIAARFHTMAATDFWWLHAGLALVAMTGFALLRVTLWRQVSAAAAPA